MVERLRRRAPAGAGVAAGRTGFFWSAAGSSACARALIDPFFFGQPSGIVTKLMRLVRERHLDRSVMEANLGGRSMKPAPDS